MTAYQVVAECAHVPVTDLSGVRATHLLYKGAFLPEGVDEDRLKFLIDGGFVAKAGDTPIAPNASVEQDPARGLDSVTEDGLRGEKLDEPRQDPALKAGEKVAETVTAEGGIDKAAEAPRQASDDAEVEAKRADARAKLDAAGGKVDGRSSDAVMVEFLARNGYEYGEVSKAERGDLKALVAQVQQQ